MSASSLLSLVFMIGWRRDRCIGADGRQKLSLEWRARAMWPTFYISGQLCCSALRDRDRFPVISRKQLMDRHAEYGLVGQSRFEAGRPSRAFMTRDFCPARRTKKERNFLLGKRTALPISPQVIM